MPRHLLTISTAFVLLLLLLVRCGPDTPAAPPYLAGRWEVVQSEGMSVPHSFFWLSADYYEFREDGEVWALIHWPPGTGSEIRLNTRGEYSLVGQDQIEFVGSCRHEDPCTGRYTVTRDGDALQITQAEARLGLKWVGPPGETPPPAVVGPSPSPTPQVAP